MAYDIAAIQSARLWNFPHNWAAPLVVRRSFLTDIIVSRNNTEQRRSLRAVPRYAIEFENVLAGDDLRAAKYHLRFAQNAPAAVPDFSRYALTTGTSSAGATSITVASPPAWIAAGQLAHLCSSSQSELVEILSVAGSTINLAEPLASEWPAAATIRPVVFGLLGGSIQGSMITRGAQSISMGVQAYPGAEPPEDEGTAGDALDGYEILTAGLEFGGGPSVEYLWPVETVDYGIGRDAQFRPVLQHEQIVQGDFVGYGAAEVRALEQFWLRHKGRRSAFYRPTCEKDMVLIANASGASIDVAGTTIADDFDALDAPYTDLAIEIVLIDGSRIRRHVTGATVVGSNSRLALSASVTATIANVARISWMPLCRFANDELVTRWISPSRAVVQLAIQSIRLAS